jgi:eukaryotic-like serine/threonine-protein kinase
MTPERYQRVKEIYHAALEREADDRSIYLEQACGADAELRAEVESLLAVELNTGRFLDSGLASTASLNLPTLPDLKQTLALIGTHVGPYKLLKELGHGGMGVVYLAERDDAQFKQRVALKLVKRGMDTDEILSRFRYERQILASLAHPNIARLLDGGTTQDGLPYFVMEYIEGAPIDQYCQQHNLSPAERLKLFRTVCTAVHYAHQNLVVHRDLKPTNILVTPDGTVKLLDFGIAKVLKPELFPETVAPTRTWARAMTPAYASPEQVRGQTVTTASDVYSLGVVLYELLTGQRPYQIKGSLPHEIAKVICESEPQKPSTAAAERLKDESDKLKTGSAAHHPSAIGLHPSALRGDLDNIVLMALRKEPLRRYASVEQFSEDLRRHLEGLPVIAREDTLRYRFGKFVRRNRAGVAVGAVISLLLLAFLITTLIQATRIRRERDRAQIEREKAEKVSAFLVDLFKVNDPSESKGNTVTARELLDRGAEKIAQELKDQPESQARLTQVMGDAYLSLGLYDRAAPLLESSLQTLRRSLGNEHPQVGVGLSHLAHLHFNQGDYVTAAALHREALAIHRKAYGAEHDEVARDLTNLATNLMRAKGDLAESEKLFREALTIQRKLHGNEYNGVATTLNDLALLLFNKGDLNAAELMQREALTLYRRTLGQEHSEVATALSNLAVTLQRKGNTAEAVALYREALALQQKLFGAEHQSPALTMNNLALLLQEKGDYEAAEPLQRQALAIQRKRLGDSHPDVAVNMSNLALLLHQMDQYAASEALFREGLAIRRKLYGEEHPDIALTLANLGMLLCDKGDYAAAEPVLRQSLQMRRKLLPKGHFHIAHSLVGLGRLLTERGEARNAEPLLHEAVENYRNALPAGHWLTADAESVLGGCLVALKRYEEAEPLLTKSYPILKASRGERAARTRQALDRLIRFYQAWGKPDKVAQYRALLKIPAAQK